MAIKEHLLTLFPDTLQQHIPLASYTTFRIGGPAEYLIEARQAEDIITAFWAAKEENIPFYLLAGCSNVLICDEGLRGLVVINKSRNIEWNKNHSVTVETGLPLDDFVSELSNQGWADLTFAAGIPGSIGGALIGGAGAFGHLVHEYLLEAIVLKADGEVLSLPAKALGIGYRESEARSRGDIILSAKLGCFTEKAPEELLSEIQRIKNEREGKHPDYYKPSAGSFFKNLPPEEPGGRRIPAGKLLDEVGAKSLRVGDAAVFEKHANIIINRGHATAAQVNELADKMAALVKERFHITLEREVLYLT